MRVSAIMDAANQLFAERDFDAVTMTEIAARSGTAIGSLYRFFPSKAAVAEALLERYGARIDAGLRQLGEGPGLAPGNIADALADFMLALGADRAAAIALIEAHTDTGIMRQKIRGTMLRRISALLCRAFPGLGRGDAEIKAATLLHLLKSLAAAQDGPAGVTAELRDVMRRYVAGLQTGLNAQPMESRYTFDDATQPPNLA